MKKLILKHSNFYATCLFILAASVVFSCSNQEDPANQESNHTQSELIEKSKQFASLHNECIKNVLSELKTSSIAHKHTSVSSVRSNVFLITDNYIQGKHSHVRNTQTNICYNDTIKDIVSQDIPSIRNIMTTTEIAYVERSMVLYETDKSLDNLMIEVEKSDLPHQNKEAILNFMTTLEASSEYWEAEGEEWIDFLEKNLPEEELQKFTFYDKAGKIQWKQVAFADAYYGWFGTVSTGGNLIVGAGAAAAGSIFSALNFF